MRIHDLIGRAVYDSNGSPTIEVEVVLESGLRAAEFAPRGSTTGEFEAHVLEDPAAYPGLAAVAPALAALTDRLVPALRGRDVTDQRGVDVAIRDVDTDPALRHVGGNVAVATSMAVASAGALATARPLHRHLAAVNGRADLTDVALPRPMFNIADGAPGSATAYTEFLYLPVTDDVAAALEQGVRVRAALGALLRRRGFRPADSTQGGWSLDLAGCAAALDAIVAAAGDCGLSAGTDYRLGLDLSGAEYATAAGYKFPWSTGECGAAELVEVFADWVGDYPLVFLEDPFAPDDHDGWRALRARLGAAAAVIGDDLFASAPARIEAGVRAGLADGALVKPNQVGTVTDALDALAIGHALGAQTVVSQRSGENGGAFITHLAVAGRATWLKAGGMSRMDRVAKYNELLRIGGAGDGR